MKTDERNKFAIKSFLGEYLDLKKDKDNELAFWEYLLPNADRKLLKAIHKSTNLHKYTQAVHAFFNQR